MSLRDARAAGWRFSIFDAGGMPEWRANEALQLTACMHHRMGGRHLKTFPSRRSLRPQLSARPLCRPTSVIR